MSYYFIVLARISSSNKSQRSKIYTRSMFDPFSYSIIWKNSIRLEKIIRNVVGLLKKNVKSEWIEGVG